MSLLNFIAGGLGAGERPYQVRNNPIIQYRSALGCGVNNYSHSLSPTLSYTSSASTIAQHPPAQPNISPGSSLQEKYHLNMIKFSTPGTLDPYKTYSFDGKEEVSYQVPKPITQDPILTSFNSFFAIPYNRPSTTIKSRAYQNLQGYGTEQYYII